MKNAFNECIYPAFFAHVREDFPEISAWVKWCYSQSGELRFGRKQMVASSGVSHWVLYFSLLSSCNLLMLHDLVQLNIWYLDDGTLVGKRSSLQTLLSHFIS